MLNENGREIRCYDYVNHPYERVRDALRKDAVAVFQSATKSAASQAQSIATELHVDFGGVGIQADVKVSLRKVEEKVDTIPSPTTRLLIEWEAASLPSLFPLMIAELAIYPLTATDTQLDFFGHYKPPLGSLGTAINAFYSRPIHQL